MGHPRSFCFRDILSREGRATRQGGGGVEMSLSSCRHLLTLFLFLIAAMAGEGQQATPPPRVFHLDLKSLDAIGLVRPFSEDLRKSSPPGLPESVAFIDSSTLVVSFPIFNSRTELSTRNKPRGGSHLFHTALIDVLSGRVVAETSWGTAHDEDAVLSLPGGHLLVRSGDKLAVASREWKQEHEYPLPKPGPGERPAQVLLSPSGQTVFVVMKAGEHQEHVDVLASATLTRLYAFEIESVGLDAGSDSYFAYLLPGKTGYALFELPLSTLGKGSLPSLQPLYFTHGDGCSRPDFVTDDLLVLTGGSCDAVALIAPDGQVKAQGQLGSRLALIEVKTSRRQARFAVIIFPAIVPRGTEGIPPIPDPVRVYDVTRLATVSEVEFAEHSIGFVHRVDHNVSPDGTLLAVLDGFDVTVYRLPPPQASGSPAAATLTTGAVPASVPAGRSAQPATPATTLGGEGTRTSEVPSNRRAPVQSGSAIEVTADLQDLRQDAIRAWVHIANHGTADITLAPERATLEILSPGQKMLRAMNPDKLATAIQRIGEDDAKSLRSGCEATDPGYGTAPCPKALASASDMEYTATATAADVRSSALRAQVLKPGEQAQGAIFFTYQKKRGEAVLRLPIGDQVFEFHFPPKAK